MLLIACALSLLAIAAGMMLLAQTKKENLGNLYKYVSWFIVIMGFLCIICIGCRSAMRCCMRGEREGHIKMLMMRDGDGCYMGGQMNGYGMMGCRRGMMGCGPMMMGGGCCPMGSCRGWKDECHEDMGSCHDGMNGSCKDGMDGSCQEGMGSCHEGMGECHEGMGEQKEGSCPMHGMMMNKKDSAKGK